MGKSGHLGMFSSCLVWPSWGYSSGSSVKAQVGLEGLRRKISVGLFKFGSNNTCMEKLQR